MRPGNKATSQGLGAGRERPRLCRTGLSPAVAGLTERRSLIRYVDPALVSAKRSHIHLMAGDEDWCSFRCRPTYLCRNEVLFFLLPGNPTSAPGWRPIQRGLRILVLTVWPYMPSLGPSEEVGRQDHGSLPLLYSAAARSWRLTLGGRLILRRLLFNGAGVSISRGVSLTSPCGARDEV